jgi:hypothetical protein
MTAYSSYQVAALLTFLSTGLLALFVMVRGGGRTVTRLFGIYTLAISAWSFCWFRMISATQYVDGLFWARFLHYPASFIPATFLHFVQYLLNIEKNRRQILLRRTFYGFGALFVCVAFTSGFVESVVPKQGFIYYLDPGPFYITFLIYFVITISTIHSLLFMAFKSSRTYKKTQMGCVLAAYILAYSGGTEVFLPVYNLSLPSFALYLIPLCQAIVSYTILAHRLMDITVIVRKTLIYSTVMLILTAIYLLIISIITKVFAGWTGYQTIFSSSVAAALISFCFQPLRKRVQSVIDTKFFRQYVDREEKLYELSREVITHTTPEAMGGALLQVINQALHPKGGALYLRSPDGIGFTKVSDVGATTLPNRMTEDNELARYFRDHSQPFVQDVASDVAHSRSTRLKAEREDAA